MKIRFLISLILLMTAFWGGFGPVSPDWESPQSSSWVSVVGITMSGRLVTMINDEQIEIRDLATGMVEAVHPLPCRCLMHRGQILRSGELAAFLTTDRGLLLLNLTSGQLHTPRIELGPTGTVEFSPLGEFAIHTIPSGNLNRERRSLVIRLRDGETLWRSSEILTFASDEQILATPGDDWFQNLEVRDIQTGSIAAEIEVPGLNNDRVTLADPQFPGRIYFSRIAGGDAGPGNSLVTTTWSCRLEGHRLIDMRQEPIPLRRSTSAGQYEQAVYEDRPLGVVTVQELSKSRLGRLELDLRQIAESSGLSQNFRSRTLTWQSVTAAGKATGPAIPLQEGIFACSPGGDWLVVGGSRLCGYRIPRRTRWLESILCVVIAAAIWLPQTRMRPRRNQSQPESSTIPETEGAPPPPSTLT